MSGEAGGASPTGVVCTCGTPSPPTARFCAACGRPLTAGADTAAAAEPAPPRSSGPPATAEEERRQVTALFADLSGFTTMAATMETEELLAVIDPLIARLADIVTQYGGYVEKFAGDALLALFGAPVAHEDDPVRALRAAADLHAAVAGVGPGASGLALHIGVNTGPVIARSIASGGRSDYAVLGEAVILAQRLQSLAPAGQTYVGESTQALTVAQFAFEPLGPRPVKGRTEPVIVFRVAGPSNAADRLAASPMIGRAAQFDMLREALALARTGRTVVAQLSGPAGAGKSRLLEALRDLAVADGTAVVEIAGSSYQRSTFRRLEPLFGAALRARYPGAETPEDALRQLDEDPRRPASAALTAMLMGDTDPDRPVADRVAAGLRRDLGVAADAWLTDLCTRRDVLILVDNSQWLEASSLDLLDELVVAGADRPVLLCLSGRNPPKPRESGPAVTVELGPLDDAEVRALIVDELRADPDPRLTRFVLATGHGNPLMTRELARMLRDEGLLDARLGHVRLIAGAEPRSLPGNLRALLAAQIDALRPELVRVATAAAAIGLTVSVPLLGQVLDAPAGEVRLAVDELIDAGFLRSGSPAPNGLDRPSGGPPGRPPAAERLDQVRFDNPLLRDLLYARMTGRRRRAMHAGIARALDVGGRTADRTTALRAEHLYLAGDAAGALPLLRRVAAASRRVFAPDDAALALSRAVEAARAARPDLLPELLSDLADVRFDLAEYEPAAALYADAQRSGADARAWAGQAACLRRLGQYADAERLLARALAMDESEGSGAPTVGGDRRLLWCELAATRSVSGDLAGSLEAATTGLTLGRDDDGVAGRLQSQLVRSQTLLGRLAQARTNAWLAIENLRRAGDLAGQCTALRLLGSVEESSGALDAAAATLEEGLALAERAGVVEEIGGCLINLGIVRGELDQHAESADCYARAAATFERTGNRNGQATAHGNRAYAVWRLGDPAQARHVAGRALELANEVGNHYTAADIATTLALIADSAREPDAAVRWAQAAAAEFTLAGMPDAAAESRAMARRFGSPDGAAAD